MYATKHLRQVLIMASLWTLIGCSGQRPDNIGVQDGLLTACPDSPNCVCSCEARDSHYIAPLPGDMAALRRALTQTPRNEIVRDDGDYLHVEFTTRLMRFVDDVEFLYQPEQGQIAVRSASRLGHSDLGANRQRIEELRALMNTPAVVPPAM